MFVVVGKPVFWFLVFFKAFPKGNQMLGLSDLL